jgi:hypothetical protein
MVFSSLFLFSFFLSFFLSLGKEFGLRIVDGRSGRDYFMSASSEEELKSWLDALERVGSQTLAAGSEKAIRGKRNGIIFIFPFFNVCPDVFSPFSFSPSPSFFFFKAETLL